MIPDHDNTMKWLDTLGIKGKVITRRAFWIILMLLVGGSIFTTCTQKSRLEGLQVEKREWLAEKQILVTTNQHLQSTLDQVRRIYPDLELNAAVAQVVRDVKELRGAVQLHEFIPVKADKRQSIVKALQQFVEQTPQLTNVVCQFDKGSTKRQKLASQIQSLFRDAKMPCEVEPGLFLPSRDTITIVIGLNSGVNIGDLCKILNEFMLTRVVIYNDKTWNHQLHLNIIGDPVFDQNGTARFPND